MEDQSPSMQAGGRRQAVLVRAAQKAEYIWYDGMEGDASKVRHTLHTHDRMTSAGLPAGAMPAPVLVTAVSRVSGACL